MKAPGSIHTARLVLRRPEAGDAESIFERYASDSDVTTFVSWPTHRSIEYTRVFLAFSEAEWDQDLRRRASHSSRSRFLQ